MKYNLLIMQIWAIIYKNTLNHLANKKKVFCEFVFPIIISAIYILTQIYRNSNPIISMIFSILLKMYIGMIGLSAVRELVTLFLTERQGKHRQYQMIFGLSQRCHTLSNLFYMGLYMSIFLLPFYLTINYFGFKIEYILMFGSFVISSLSLAMMLTSFFNDHKIASEIIGMVFSMSAFLPLLYSGQNDVQHQGYNFVDYLGMFIPNSSFSIAITNGNIKSSLYSLSLTKIYLFVYSCIEFPQFYKRCCKSCYQKIKNNFIQKQNKNQSQNLTNQKDKEGYNNFDVDVNDLSEQFNVNQKISQFPSQSLQEQQSKSSHYSINKAYKQMETSNKSNIMVSIKNLVKTYKIKEGQFNALNKINMKIQKKQIYGLLGRNGAGKTTLVDILTQVSQPTSGKIKINFQNKNRKTIGICYQHQILYEEMTIMQHLKFYSKIKNIQEDLSNKQENHLKLEIQTEAEQINYLIQMLGIQNQCHKKVKQLSGGNKRKLSVAIAILGKPQLLIFDEPTSGLDPLSRRNIWQIFSQLRQKFQSSIILTTHHLDQAQYLSDFITIIQKGNIIVQNTPQKIKQKYGNGYYLTLQFSDQKSENEQPNKNQTNKQTQKLIKSNKKIQFQEQKEDKNKQLKDEFDFRGQKQILQLKPILKISKEIQRIKNYLKQMKAIEKIQEVQRDNLVVKIFIKFYKDSSKVDNIEEYQDDSLIQMIKWLQNQKNLKIQIQENSLQQSFIAILKDPQNTNPMNSNESLDLNNRTQRLQSQFLNDVQLIFKLKKLCNQILGMFIRCVYFHKRQFIKFILMYNINILIFLVSIMFNKFIKQSIQDQTNISSGHQNSLQNQIKNMNEQNNSKQSQNYQNSMLILQGYVIMAAAFIAISVYQREKKIKMVFNTRGLNPFAYWFGSFLFDYICFLINLIIMVNFVTPESFQFLDTFQPLLSLGVGMILFAYASSHLFDKVTTANTWFSLINILIGFMILPIVMIAKGTFLQNLKFIKFFYPFYDLNSKIMSQNKQLDQIYSSSSSSFPNRQEDHYIYFSIAFYIFVLVFIELALFKRIKTFLQYKYRSFFNNNANNEQLGSQLTTYNMKLENVSKNYGSQIQALKNVNYFVQNQRFALLGHNGAGKSTTFGLLSSQIHPTSGKIYLQHNLKMPYHSRMNSAGICFQDDALWEDFTPLQIMNIFSYIVPHQNSNKQTIWLFENLQFEKQNFNKRFQNLSGGNKRKVCMAASLYGDPNIRLLDECSTGLDPSSRFAMVETIKQSSQGSTIFTTHSMGQAENLCSKTVIMKNGQVLQFDYIHKLKKKYYNCFWIDLYLNKNLEDQVQGMINIKNFDQNYKTKEKDDEKVEALLKQKKQTITQIIQKQQNKIKIVDLSHLSNFQNKIRIQLQKTQWKLSEILETVIKKWKLKKNGLIENYSICQPKLQDVYLNITKE